MDKLDYRVASVVIGSQAFSAGCDALLSAHQAKFLWAIVAGFAAYGLGWLTVALWREA
jgi:hypothetical protein